VEIIAKLVYFCGFFMGVGVVSAPLVYGLRWFVGVMEWR
jgi:hypothetical protein